MQYSKQHIKSEIQKHRDNDNRTFNPFHVTDFLFCQTLKKKSTTNINIEKQINTGIVTMKIEKQIEKIYCNYQGDANISFS